MPKVGNLYIDMLYMTGEYFLENIIDLIATIINND
jgi:hypothetical protein